MSDLPVFFKIGVVLLAVVMGAWFRLGFLARARFEFRTQILELLALAAQRQQPLLNMLEHAKREYTGKRRRIIEQICQELASGRKLSDSLARSSVMHFPHSLTDSLRAAEGGDQLATMLRYLSSLSDRTSMAQHRLGLALIYPAILCALLLGLQASFNWLSYLWQQADEPAWILLVMANLTWGALSLCFAFYLLSPKSPVCAFLTKLAAFFLPAFAKLRRLNASERQLRSLSMLLDSGFHFPEALRRTAACSGDRRDGARYLVAAELADAAAPVEEVWAQTGLPSYVRYRAAAASSTTQEHLASVLGGLAAECENRFQSCLDKTLAFINPMFLLFLGGILAFKFYEFFGFLDTLRGGVSPW